MQLLCSILLWFGGITGCSEWYAGQIKLSDGNSLVGKVSYCLEQDLVLLKNEKQTVTLSPVNVENFVFFDKEALGYRIFYPLPLKEKNGYKRLRFFELHYLGSMSLFSREHETIERLPEMDNREGTTPYVSVISDKFYMVNHLAEVSHLSGRLKDVVKAFKYKEEDIKAYIKSENIEIKSKDGLIAVLTYYDSIRNE